MYLKYLKALLYIFIPTIVITFLLSILHYFNILNSSIIDYLKLFTIILSMFVGGIYIGSKANSKGWLEGLKIGGVIIILFFIISYLAFDKGINIKNLIYYLILLASSTLGSMIGISKKKEAN